MNNPYEILGIGNDADEQEIKKAYRDKAKKAHLDAGGDVEKFGELSLAYSILSDEERRAFYDRTGSDKGVSSPENLALHLVMSLIDDLLSNITHEDLMHTDIIKKAKDKLNAVRSDISRQEKIHTEKLSFITKSEKILTEQLSHKRQKSQNNLFLSVLHDKQKNMQLALSAIEQQKSVLDMAVDLIDDFEFKAKERDIDIESTRFRITKGMMGSGGGEGPKTTGSSGGAFTNFSGTFIW